MQPEQEFHHRSWGEKFYRAARGIVWGVQGRSRWIDRGFAVHLAATVGVVMLAIWLAVATWEWCVLMLCFGMVWTAELLNAAVEILSRAVTRQYNQLVQRALDISAGAVLLSSFAAAIIAALIFLPKVFP